MERQQKSKGAEQKRIEKQLLVLERKDPFKIHETALFIHYTKQYDIFAKYVKENCLNNGNRFIQNQGPIFNDGGNQNMAKSVSKSSRGYTSPEDFAKATDLCYESLSLIVSSWRTPVKKSLVPRSSPDQSEWSGILNRMKDIPSLYKKLYRLSQLKTKKKGGSTNGGLTGRVKITREVTQFINNSGIIGSNKIPTDSQGLGVFNRAMLTSFFSAYVFEKGLKHPNEPKWNIPDEALLKLITIETLEKIKNNKKYVKEKVTFRKINGKMIPLFSYNAITIFLEQFILGACPNVDNKTESALQNIFFLLKQKREKRNEAAKKKRKKTTTGRGNKSAPKINTDFTLTFN